MTNGIPSLSVMSLIRYGPTSVLPCNHSNTGTIVFQAHGVLFQCVELLSSSLSPDDYSTFIPSLGDLCSKYGLEPAVAFHIMRPALEKVVSVCRGVVLVSADAHKNWL